MFFKRLRSKIKQNNKSQNEETLIDKDEEEILSDEELLSSINKSLNNYSQGDIIHFGRYDWKILEIKKNMALLITTKAVDSTKDYGRNHYTTWENSNIREELNTWFFNTKFSSNEKKRIVKVCVSADKNPEFPTDPGKNTMDYVFLLSIEEVNKYFPSDELRKCVPIDSLIERGRRIYWGWTNFGACSWWLRTPGQDNSRAATILSNGAIDCRGEPVRNYACCAGCDAEGDSVCIRPSIWIEL